MAATDQRAVIDHQKNLYSEHWSRRGTLLAGIRYPEASAWRVLCRTLSENGVKRAARQKVFDYGFGHGKVLLWFAPPTEIHGVELSQSALAEARRRAVDRGFATDALLPAGESGDLRSPFAADSFDVVVCSHTIEHVPDDQALVNELHRVLKPGGKAFLIVPLDLPEARGIVAIPEQRRNLDYPTTSFHVWLYNLGTFADMVRRAGFSIVSARRLDAVWPARFTWPRPIQMASSVAFSFMPYSWWAALDNRLLRRGIEGRQAVVVATKP